MHALFCFWEKNIMDKKIFIRHPYYSMAQHSTAQYIYISDGGVGVGLRGLSSVCSYVHGKGPSGEIDFLFVILELQLWVNIQYMANGQGHILSIEPKL